MERYTITTTDNRRRGVWLALFGRDTLPVFAPTPRWQPMMEAGMVVMTPAYDLDLAALPATAVCRYAAWKSRREQRSYEEVRSELMCAVSVPIKAANCKVVVIEERQGSRTPLFDFFSRIFARLQTYAT